MPSVKLWNDNVHPHTEAFNGTTYTIPANGFIELDYFEACALRGNYYPRREISEGVIDPKTYKMLRVEEPAEMPFTEKPVHHATGKEASTAAELAAVITQFAAENRDRMVVDKDLDSVSVKKTDFENMMARLAALEAKDADKRGPGRPKKEA